MTKNEAASVAQMTDEQIVILRRETYKGAHAPRASDLAFARALLAQATPPAAPVHGDAWIVVKEHAWHHEDGGHPTLAYLWPSEFAQKTYASFAAASQFIRENAFPLGWVAMPVQFPALLTAPAAPAAPVTGESGAEPYRQRSARLSAGRLSDAERAAIEALYATPPAAEAASQPGEMGAGVPTECQTVFGEPCQYARDIASGRVHCIHCDRDKPASAQTGVQSAPEKCHGCHSRCTNNPPDCYAIGGAWERNPSASAQQDEPMEWRIEVGGPSGYVRFETFQGVTLDDALDSAVAQNFYPAQDEDGWTRIEVKV